jgi:hypothetical protein
MERMEIYEMRKPFSGRGMLDAESSSQLFRYKLLEMDGSIVVAMIYLPQGFNPDCYESTNVVCVWKRLDNKVAAEPAISYVFSSTPCGSIST